jgi:hypothetical protein
MLKYHKISHSGGKVIKVILANTKYEAVGFYLMEEVDNIGTESLDKIEILPSNYKVEVSYAGFSVSTTLEEIYFGKEIGTTPQTVV